MKSIRMKMISLLVISLVPVLIIIVSTIVIVQQQEYDAMLINLAGRQRMLTQKMTKELLAYLAGHGETYGRSARQTMELFDRTLLALKDGGKTIDAAGKETPVPAADVEEIKQGLEKVLKLWRPFKSNFQIVLDPNIDRHSTQYKQALEYILKQNPIVLKEMNNVVGLMAADSRSKVSILYTIQIVGGLLVLLVYGLVLLFIDKSILKRLMGIRNWVLQVADNRDLVTRIDQSGSDELSDLARALNNFLDNVQSAMKEVRANMQVVVESARQISTSTEQLAAGAEEQQAQLSEVATSMEEINAMIYQSSQNVQETKNNAAQADTQAREGANQVDESVRRIVEIADIVEKTSKQIQALQSRSREIGEVIAVIDDIADQTNLLALNANIEAARAGDAGRGFAVVADEVRKLAERTIQATAEIEEKIQQIQNDVGDAVQAMEGIRKRARDGREVAESAGNMISGITEAIAQVTEAVSQIATAANEQSSGSEMISKNVESVSMVAKENAQAAQDLAHLAENLNQRMRRLDEIVESFKLE